MGIRPHLELKTFARKLRKNQTSAERRLWAKIRCRQLASLKFLRQYRIAGFILDFYCPSASLGIELDGSSHNGREDYDAFRDRKISRAGIKILRFPNHRAFNDMKAVLKEIEEAAKGRRYRPSAFAATWSNGRAIKARATAIAETREGKHAKPTSIPRLEAQAKSYTALAKQPKQSRWISRMDQHQKRLESKQAE